MYPVHHPTKLYMMCCVQVGEGLFTTYQLPNGQAAYMYYNAGSAMDEAEVAPVLPPPRPTTVPLALQQGMPLAQMLAVMAKPPGRHVQASHLQMAGHATIHLCPVGGHAPRVAQHSIASHPCALTEHVPPSTSYAADPHNTPVMAHVHGVQLSPICALEACPAAGTTAYTALTPSDAG
jgi:hypothetical protein